MGWRTRWYGPLVTSSGSLFCVMGDPQLRPMCTRADTAKPRPSANRPRPRAERQGSVLRAWLRKTPRRTKITTMTAIKALILNSLDHGTLPLFMDKAATSQYNQNAPHPTAKTISTACTGASLSHGLLTRLPLDE